MIEPPISKSYSKKISQMVLEMMQHISDIGEELCPVKPGEDPDLPVVFSFGLLGWDLLPESDFKVYEFCGGALYVFKRYWVEKKYSTQLWDFYHDLRTWEMLLYWAENHKLNPETSPIRSVERRKMRDKYEEWKMEK